MVSADNFTYATIQRSVLDLAKNYGFTHCDTSAIECLTSAVYHYMQQVCKDTKFSTELAGRSAACSSDVLLAIKNNRLDVETLNQYMIWNEPIKTSTELPQYPVNLPERPESPFSDAELKEREEKDIPKFAPSIRIKPKVKKPLEEPVKEEDEEENFDELTLAAMRICSSIKPITHAAKNVDEFDKLTFVLSESLPSFDHYCSKYENEIDFLGNSLAAQEAAAATAAVKEQIRQEEEAHRQKILEQEKLQYQQPQYYQQPEEPMIDFEDARQQKMVEFSKQFIPEMSKPEIAKEEPSRMQSPSISTLAEDLYVSPSPSPPPEIKSSYSQEPPSVKPIPEKIISESLPPITVVPTPLINDLNQNTDIKNVEKEKHRKKHKHHKEKRREKKEKEERKKDEERQHEEEKKSKKDKHKDKKKEKRKDREKDKGKNHEKTKDRKILKNFTIFFF
uniref:Bromodomain associated domain-containing protein n=1 Tax=Panagrolaimus superbus TaxID=310955 RepID=A0A914YJ91_9BILA